MADSSSSNRSIFSRIADTLPMQNPALIPEHHRQGRHPDDAIVLDDDEDEVEQLDAFDICDDVVFIKAEPSANAIEHTEISNSLLDPPQATYRTDSTDDDELFVSNEETKAPKHGNSRYTVPVYNNGTNTQQSEISKQNHRESFAYRGVSLNEEHSPNPRTQGVPIACMYPQLETAEPNSQAGASGNSLINGSQNTLGRKNNLPAATIFEPSSRHKQIQISPGDTQQPSRCTSATSTANFKPMSPSKQASPAKPVGFAALASANGNIGSLDSSKTNGTTISPNMDKYTSSTTSTHFKGNAAGKDYPATLSKKNSSTLSSSVGSSSFPIRTPKAIPKKPRKSLPNRSEPSLHVLDVLKSNRKRPLSEMSIGQLFTPKQVISNSEWEAKKRLRFEKKVNSALNDGTNTTQVQDRVDNSAKEVPISTESGLVDVNETTTKPDYTQANKNGADESHKKPHFEKGQLPAKKSNHFQQYLYQKDKPNSRLKSPSTVPHAAAAANKSTIQAQKSTTISNKHKAPQQPKLHDRFPTEQSDNTGAEVQTKRRTTSPRPTTGGKGISPATLAAWQAESEGTKDSHFTAELEELDIDNSTLGPAFQYYVSRLEGKVDSLEADLVEEKLGPFHTVEEANAVASKEIRHPFGRGKLDGTTNKGWSFYFEQDEYGMQSHAAEVLGIRIEAAVQRELAPPEPRLTYPPNAFKTPPKVYLIQELAWSPISPPTTSPPTLACDTTTHDCVTTLNHANRIAADLWLETYTGNWSDVGSEGRRKTEVERALKREMKEMKEMKEVRGLFHREAEFESGGVVKIWVEEVVVRGARN